jgi:calcineurin-like phosphoesterase family protein
MTVWFTSDLHFGHRLVAGHRGFGENTDEMDFALMSNWARVVQESDVVWVLGDLCLRNPTDALSIIDNLPGRKHFISGNHDPCHPMHRRNARWQRQFLEVFETVQPFAREKWAGHEFLLSHFPYEKDRGEARYGQYRLPNEGKWLLHGHTHDTAKYEGGTEIHVGVDAWNLHPVSLEDVLVLRQAAEEGMLT